MGKTRPFVKEDIPQVVNLHPRAFEDSNRPPSTYFEEVFLNNPWFDESLSSLVYEQNDGKIIGFLGVIPRRFSFNRRTIQVAISTQFMVDRSSRSTMAGLQLQKTFLAGPQDLSMADFANSEGRKIWGAFKGHSVLISKLRWRRVLRSSSIRRVQFLLRRWKQPAPVAMASRSLCSWLDAFEVQTLGNRFCPKAPQVSEVEINENTIITHLPEFFGDTYLRPEYDERSLKWLLGRAAEKKRFGKLRKVGVCNEAGEIIGWYVYSLLPGEKARVLHIAAKQNSAHKVLDSLFYRAWQGRANSVHGRLEPHIMTALAAKSRISYSLGEYWMMVHSRDPELLSVIHRGDAFLTLLEGEWLMGFHEEKTYDLNYAREVI
jgi:hypothetical protein